MLAPLFLFLIQQRVPNLKAPARERYSVYWTNLGIGAVAAGLIYIFGLKAWLIIQLPMLLTAGSAGVWLFYVQHQFEGVYWERAGEWDYATAALHGSSFYKLPKILQWFSGNIGFHHIHHLSSRIPNYHLEKAHQAEPLFQTVKPITLFPSMKSLTLRLWDEQRQRRHGRPNTCLRACCAAGAVAIRWSSRTAMAPDGGDSIAHGCGKAAPAPTDEPFTLTRSSGGCLTDSGRN